MSALRMFCYLDVSRARTSFPASSASRPITMPDTNPMTGPVSAISSLLRFDSRIGDHLAPLRHLRADERAEIFGLATRNHRAGCRDLLFHVRRGKRAQKLPIERLNRRSSCSCRYEKTVPD